MPEVQNIGAADYAQYQPSQSQQYDNYAEELDNQPQVYDQAAADAKAAAASKITAAAITALIVGGLAYWGGHSMGSKGLKAEKEKAAEAIANYNKLFDASKNVEKLAEEGNQKYWWNNDFCGKDFVKKVKELFKDFTKTAEDAKETVEKAGEDVTKAVKESAENAA